MQYRQAYRTALRTDQMGALPALTPLVALLQVHMSEERLESTIEELTRLEMAAHGFTAALSHRIESPSVVHAGISSSSSSSSSALREAHSQQQSSNVAQAASSASIAPAQAEAYPSSAGTVYREASSSSSSSNSNSSSTALLQDPQRGEQQRQSTQPPERQRKRYGQRLSETHCMRRLPPAGYMCTKQASVEGYLVHVRYMMS